MGAFNEIYHSFETIQKKSERIYNDAADHGYPYNSKNIPTEVEQFIEIVKNFRDESNMMISKDKWNNGVSYVFRVPIEHDAGLETGYEYNVSANVIDNPKHPSLIKKGCNIFISVDTKFYHKDLKTGELV